MEIKLKHAVNEILFAETKQGLMLSFLLSFLSKNCNICFQTLGKLNFYTILCVFNYLKKITLCC